MTELEEREGATSKEKNAEKWKERETQARKIWNRWGERGDKKRLFLS